MIELTRIGDTPFHGVLGVVLRRFPPFTHCGFIYQKQSGEFALSHLAFHYLFFGEAPPEVEYLWLDSVLDIEVCETIAEYLEMVAEANRDMAIPYSIVYPIDSCFDQTGDYVGAVHGQGLTCATYILAIFEYLKWPLIRRDTWPLGRPDDIEWARLIIARMEEKSERYSLEHLEAQRVALPQVVRYRPQEVAAAFALYPFVHEYLDGPLAFNEIEQSSLEIEAQIE